MNQIVKHPGIVEGYTATGSNCTIRYAISYSSQKQNKGSFLLLGGRFEFIEKYKEIISELNQRGFDVFTMDWRGQGLSTRLLSSRMKGYVKSYEDYLKDMDIVLKKVVLPKAKKPFYCLAHSMGAHIALRYAVDFGSPFNKIVLTSPMIEIITKPFPVWFARFLTYTAVKIGMETSYAPGEKDYIMPDKTVFEHNPLTSDFKRYMLPHMEIKKNSRLALGGVTYGWLKATFESMDILCSRGYVSEIKTPVLIVSAGADKVVSIKAQKKMCRMMSECNFYLISDSYHEILRERDHILKKFWIKFDEFIG